MTDTVIQRIAALVLLIGLALGIYCVLALRGDVAPAPWSPLGRIQKQQQDQQPQPLVFDRTESEGVNA